MRNLLNKCVMILLTLLLIVSSAQNAYSIMVTDYYNYWYSNSETPPTITWTASTSTDVIKYQVVAQWVVGTEIRQTFNIGEVTATEIQIPAPKIGSFIIGVRAVDSEGLSSPYIYSNVSANSNVNGQPRAWMITYYMDKPGGIIIGAIATKDIKEIL